MLCLCVVDCYVLLLLCCVLCVLKYVIVCDLLAFGLLCSGILMCVVILRHMFFVVCYVF